MQQAPEVSAHSATETNAGVLVSVLNWNSAEETAACVESLLASAAQTDVPVEILVIDNGSADEDYRLLESLIGGGDAVLHRESQNLGFAGGHNIAIRRALQQKRQFVWLVNSDAVVQRNTLDGLVRFMDAHPRCGSASPVVLASHDESFVDYCGAAHDWLQRQSIRAQSVEACRKLEEERPASDLWVSGAAVMFRMQALREVGFLDERYFAYYEDNDIGARLAHAGWKNLAALDLVVHHDCRGGLSRNRPDYYFYLLNRNHMVFWHRHTPQAYRRMLWLKLVKAGLYDANKLAQDGLHSKSDASLLGVGDFILGRHGAPDLSRPLPQWLKVARWCSEKMHGRALHSRKRLMRSQDSAAIDLG